MTPLIQAEEPRLVTQRISDIEVSSRRLRVFLANRAIALGWALKGSCKACANRLFAIARCGSFQRHSVFLSSAQTHTITIGAF